MKIPFTNIILFENKHDEPKTAKQRQRIINKIVKRQLHRQKINVGSWRRALMSAESVLNPDRTELMRTYKDVVIDSHLSALMSTLVNKVLSGGYWLEDENGEKDEAATEKINKSWFTKMLVFAIESKFYGYSLIQLGEPTEDGFTWVKLVPREYVVPDQHGVKSDLHVTKNLIDYSEPPFDKWVIGVGDPFDLGQLAKASPLAIWKKDALINWSEYAEIFGMPVRMGKTDITDPDAKKNMDEMLSNMGSAAYGVFNNDDEIEFVETSNQDAYEVFDKLVERANSEMSKLILGQTMTTDNGSSRSQAQVHENVLNDNISALKHWLLDVVNDQFIPKLVMHRILKPGLFFRWDNSEKLTLQQHSEIILGLADHYKIPTDYINETLNIPVEEKATLPEPLKDEDGKIRNLYNEIENLYAGYFKPHSH